MPDYPFHIVLTLDGIRLVAWPGAETDELASHFEDYVRAFGPFDADGVCDLIEAEWPDLAKLKAADIEAVLRGDLAQVRL